jgi:hypothetical protein
MIPKEAIRQKRITGARASAQKRIPNTLHQRASDLLPGALGNDGVPGIPLSSIFLELLRY